MTISGDLRKEGDGDDLRKSAKRGKEIQKLEEGVYASRGGEGCNSNSNNIGRNDIFSIRHPHSPLSIPYPLFAGGVVSRPSRHDCLSTLRQPQALVALASQTAFSSPSELRCTVYYVTVGYNGFLCYLPP